MPTVEQVLTKYFELDQREEEMSKRHAAEMKPLSEAKQNIKAWLMNQMNSIGSDQLKVQGLGIAFKSTSTSVKMADPVAFKQFIFAPALEGIKNYLAGSGLDLPAVLFGKVGDIIRDLSRWDMVDFRAGKKGIVEYQENENASVPGVTFDQFATISIRRA